MFFFELSCTEQTYIQIQDQLETHIAWSHRQTLTLLFCSEGAPVFTPAAMLLRSAACCVCGTSTGIQKERSTTSIRLSGFSTCRPCTSRWNTCGHTAGIHLSMDKAELLGFATCIDSGCLFRYPAKQVVLIHWVGWDLRLDRGHTANIMNKAASTIVFLSVLMSAFWRQG